MAEYNVEVKAPVDVLLTVLSKQGQQIKLPKDKFVHLTLEYEGDTLLFDGENIKQIASLKSIGDVFWMILSLTSKGFEFRPNEPLDIIKKLTKV